MKKLEKLTLKELGDSAIAVCPTEEQRSIVAGSGYWITGNDGQQYYVEINDVVVTAQKLVEIGESGTYIPAEYTTYASQYPPTQESIGNYQGPSYGETLAQVALGLLGGAYILGAVAVSCIIPLDLGISVYTPEEYNSMEAGSR